jgi:hypothetical protein
MMMQQHASRASERGCKNIIFLLFPVGPVPKNMQMSIFAIGGLMIVVLLMGNVLFVKSYDTFYRIYLLCVSLACFGLISIGLPAFSMFIGIVAGVLSIPRFSAAFIPSSSSEKKD